MSIILCSKSKTENFVLLQSLKPLARARRHQHGLGEVREVKINLAQTKHRMRIVKLQPAVKVHSTLKIFSKNFIIPVNIEFFIFTE